MAATRVVNEQGDEFIVPEPSLEEDADLGLYLQAPYGYFRVRESGEEVWVNSPGTWFVANLDVIEPLHPEDNDEGKGIL